MSAVYTRAEVAKHATPESNWIIIDDKVYDVTKFARFHPGGKAFIDKVAGSDATKHFYAFHRQDVLRSMTAKYAIGTIADPPPPKKANVVLRPGELSRVPYAEPSAFQGLPTAFYNESHHRFRADLRRFFDEEVMPDAVANDAQGKHPPIELWQRMGSRGMLASRIQAGPWLRDIVDNCGVTLPGGIAPEQFDAHELIAHEEFCRLGVPGYCDGLGAGFVIGLPRVAVRVTRGGFRRARGALRAQTHPPPSQAPAGSDVAGLDALLRRPVWEVLHRQRREEVITNGTFADYFVTAVRTGGPGVGGVSLLLVERSEGLETKPIKTSYSSAGTAYVTYDDVKVPVGNLLGKENQGFRCIMHNFNHERWYIVAGANRASRLVVEECLWAYQREFCKPPRAR